MQRKREGEKRGWQDRQEEMKLRDTNVNITACDYSKLHIVLFSRQIQIKVLNCVYLCLAQVLCGEILHR